MRFGSSGSVSRNQICCISKQDHSLPYCDEGDESIFYLTLSDKRKKDEKNMCWSILGKTDLEEKETSRLCVYLPAYICGSKRLPTYSYLSIHIPYIVITSPPFSRMALTSSSEQA